MHRTFTTSVASVYPLYVAKMNKKGRAEVELEQVIAWLTGFDRARLHEHLGAGTTSADFFADATINRNAGLITGSVCGVRVEEIGDPLMRTIRYLDELADELARGKAMDEVLRS